MATAEKIAKMVRQMAINPADVKFSDLLTVCVFYFGDFRKQGSHRVFTMPWAGDPRVNIQDKGSKAKPYQVKQVLTAIEKKEAL